MYNSKLIGFSLHKPLDKYYSGIDIHLYNWVICIYLLHQAVKFKKKFRFVVYDMKDDDIKEGYYQAGFTYKFIGILL